jgi:hypothetical protein
MMVTSAGGAPIFGIKTRKPDRAPDVKAEKPVIAILQGGANILPVPAPAKSWGCLFSLSRVAAGQNSIGR